MTKHLCIKKEDGLYINGAKCTDGFTEGREYSESEFVVINDFKLENGVWTDTPEKFGLQMVTEIRQSAILLPALKEDSGLSLWMEVIKDIERAQFIEEKYIATIDRLSTNYTITKKIIR